MTTQTYTFVTTDEGKPATFTLMTTTPKNVKAFQEHYEQWMADEANGEKSTMDMVFALVQFIAKPAGDVHPSMLDFDDFDLKLGQKMVEDFLPSGTAIFRTLSGF